MTTIYYTLGPNSGSIIWAASEAFDELRGKTYHLGHMEATAIVQLKDLFHHRQNPTFCRRRRSDPTSPRSGLPADQIFQTGSFQVE